MSEMRLRVAKVICERLFGPFDPSELDCPSSVSAQSMTAGIEAFEAMRQPTPEMIEALKPASVPSDARDYIVRDWGKMIDAALK